tara:strand:+ start:2093 stop:2272 length:180 start_codon:yes stop_codon:yes gene_type:complete
MVKVTYKHWKTGKELEVIGTMPPQFNNGISDRILVKTANGSFEDVIKSTIIRVEEWSPN